MSLFKRQLLRTMCRLYMASFIAFLTLTTSNFWTVEAITATHTTWKSVTLDVTDVRAVTHVEAVAPTEAVCSRLAKDIYNSTLFCFSQGACVVALAAVDLTFKRGQGLTVMPWICRTSDRHPFMRRGTDGLYYVFNASTRLTYNAAIAACAAMSPAGAYRLAQAKTSLILENIRDFWMDLPNWMGLFFIGLVMQFNGTYNWADGSALDLSILKPNEPVLDNNGHHFIIYKGLVDDQADTNTATYLCQANFENVTW